MRVLIVDEEIPWPLNTGKRLRTFNLIQRLQKKHHITYLCYGETGSSLPDCPNVELVSIPSPVLEQRGVRFYTALLANLMSGNPYIVDRHFSRLFANKAIQLASSGKFDLIHCEWTPYTENVISLLDKYPSVLSAHNVEAQIWERYHKAETNLLKKAYINIQWRKLRRYEEKSARRYTMVTTVSAPDQQVFINKYGCSNVTVVPNGVDQNYFSPLNRPQKPSSMVFTGSMDWRPNQDGVRYFIEEIFPLIRRNIPEATFTVVGRKPPQWLIDMAGRSAGVVVTGTVDDVRPYIAESTLYVVPLRVGGGSRLKILEAMSMSRIVLSTTVGAEGLDVADGKNILLSDTPKDFADKACTILGNPGAYQGYAISGRELIMERYTWDAISDVMDSVWRQARA